MSELPHPLTNTQLEILKAFSVELSEEELVEFRSVIAEYFFNRAVKSADEAWDKNEWTNDDVDKILASKASYSS